MDLPDELRTPRLRLRLSGVEDAPAVFAAWAGDPVACRYLTWPAHASEDETRAQLRDLSGERESGASRHWLAERLEDGALVGGVKLAWITSLERRLGFIVSPAAQGQGFATEIIEAASAAAFADPELERVSATVHPDNAASLRVLEKCGYDIEGRLRRSRFFANFGDEPQDLLLLARLR